MPDTSRPGQGPLKPRINDQHVSPAASTNLSSELSASPASANAPAQLSGRPLSTIENGGVIDHRIAQTRTIPEGGYQDDPVNPQKRVIALASTSGPTPSTNIESIDRVTERTAGDVYELEPYFAGESEGLEFLFDQCAPDRPVKGVHYLTPTKTYRHKRPAPHRPSPQQLGLNFPLPPRAVQEEMVRCFFHYVYPGMPILHPKEFLEGFAKDANSVSPLLLWSVFFVAVNYIAKDILRAHRLPPRKVLKEHYYQNAKELYDSHHESDKATLIACCCLMSTWYVDLEDRDGSWFWIGTGISLAHTIGLHRASNYASMPSRPFSTRTMSLWRRIWWCLFYREAWLAQGFGRPMRVCIDDCDENFPTAREVVEEFKEVDSRLADQYMPPGIQQLAETWVVLIHLSIDVADILTMHYRPRSPLPAPHVLRSQEARIMELRTRIPSTSAATPNVVLLGICHLEMFFNASLILLYRTLLAAPPSKMVDAEYVACREECVNKAKITAADTTNVLNKLMSINGIDLSPSSLTSALMTAMQILVFEMKTTGASLARNYAAHQLDLHQMVMGHLRKTYWTSDLTHNLFIEVMKLINGEYNCDPALTNGKASATDKASDSSRDELAQQLQATDQQAQNLDVFDNGQGLAAAHASLDDFFGMFNPFMGIPQIDEYRYVNHSNLSVRGLINEK